MSSITINNILKSFKDCSGALLRSKSGLRRSKSECLRNLQTETESKPKEESNKAFTAERRNSSLWRYLTGREDGCRLMEPEKAEHVFNYYKKRWGSESTIQRPADNTSEDAINADDPTSKKSLYSQWATKKPTRGEDTPSPKPSGTVNDFVVSPSHDPFRHQTASWFMSYMSKPNDEGRERCLELLRQPIPVSKFWEVDESPQDLLTNNHHHGITASDTNKRPFRSSIQNKFMRQPLNLEHEENSENEESITVPKKEARKSAVKKRFHRHEIDQRRPMTTRSWHRLFTDDIPLFDVHTTKKKNVYGGRPSVSDYLTQ